MAQAGKSTCCQARIQILWTRQKVRIESPKLSSVLCPTQTCARIRERTNEKNIDMSIPPHRLPNISFYHESLYSFLKTQHRGLHCPSSAGFQASSHAFLALPTGCFLTALGPQPALLWSLISASHVVITQDMCIELHTRRKRCTPIWSME